MSGQGLEAAWAGACRRVFAEVRAQSRLWGRGLPSLAAPSCQGWQAPGVLGLTLARVPGVAALHGNVLRRAEQPLPRSSTSLEVNPACAQRDAKPLRGEGRYLERC